MILSKITVGNILVFEVNENPSVVGLYAPVGSQAYFDDAGVGKAYLKFGGADTDWAAYQTGTEPSDWKFTTDANQLNVATAKAYFGTKAGSNFDIEFQRNGEVEMLLKATEVEFFKDIRLNGSDRYIRATNNLYVEGNFLSLSSVGSIRTYAGSYLRRVDANGSSSELSEFLTGQRSVILDATATHDFIIGTTNSGNNLMFEVRLFLQSLNGANKADVMVKKTIHVDRDGIMFLQDDFTSKNQYASSVAVTIIVDGTDIKARITGLAGLTSKIAKVEVKRLGSE